MGYRAVAIVDSVKTRSVRLNRRCLVGLVRPLTLEPETAESFDRTGHGSVTRYNFTSPCSSLNLALFRIVLYIISTINLFIDNCFSRVKFVSKTKLTESK